MEKERKLARDRASIILQVRSGVWSVTEGAQRLGVSRKTYYEWEERALGAMARVLENRPAGRPPVPVDEEKEELRRRNEELERKLFLAEKTIAVKDLLLAYDELRVRDAKKNGKADKRGGQKQ